MAGEALGLQVFQTGNPSLSLTASPVSEEEKDGSTMSIMRVARRTRRLVEDLIKLEGWPQGTDGLCARASAMLFNNLVIAGIKPKIYANWFHCFVVVDGNIIDITSDRIIKIKS